MRHCDNAEAAARNGAAIVDYRVRLLKDDAAGVIAADRSVVLDVDRDLLSVDARVVALDRFALRHDDVERLVLEIGRVSCRERVGKYGLFSVVAGALKKKKKK